MSFFKRLSRTRTDSYVEDYGDNKYRDEKYEARPSSSRRTNSQPTTPATAFAPTDSDSKDMYPRQQGPQEAYGATRGLPNGVNGTTGHNALPPMNPVPMAPIKAEPMPDLLTRAFNEAVRPYSDKIEQLESQLADLQSYVEQMEQQRAEVHSWIDKRGLRPDVPPSIAKVMDSTTPDSANTLNAQLDRKITIVNFDLHRLQDDLNDSISASHFASAMSKFLPDITRLSALPTGPRYAFDLILKLGGNLNSHGGLDTGDASDLAARRDFYGKLDQAMEEVVRRRFQENEEWAVQREIKRIEKTAAYLRNFGVEPYFPGTLDLMRRELEYRGQPAGTPPRYQ
ncbi:hypothetical protein H2201_000046 [Coniosporium apollinis]|uniref:Uncharacterized protein n=2 Tax=Coniosporium TaxID=2810619 RepID=A0ABQ9P4Z7_9PEZI|nr:hypothetical protein H2199_008310 [Cladosporium sp. JES 115]KAJ9669662.1 hypothetical protein H2201_000046 [Coniosporium apollinis]